EVEVASLPAGTGNSQPFVIDLAGEQMHYVMTMEPYGSDTRGLDEVWLIDAATGEYRFFGSDGETLTGPERAMGIVRSADSQTGWGDNFRVVEPVPVFLNDQLWWHSKVVPIDNTDISRSVFVSASTEEAVELGDTEAVREFVATGDAAASRRRRHRACTERSRRRLLHRDQRLGRVGYRAHPGRTGPRAIDQLRARRKRLSVGHHPSAAAAGTKALNRRPLP
ncbi:MAG: hypothetical protein A07HN63_00515, partial [uncultured archaeon A07HN63]